MRATVAARSASPPLMKGVPVRRHTALGVTAAGCLACLASAAPAPGAQPLAAARTVVVVREAQGVIAPGQSAGFTQLCPRRAPHPVSATFGPPDGGALAGQFLLAASYPVQERRAWRVEVKNITPLAQPFFAGAVCMGSSVRLAYRQ